MFVNYKKLRFKNILSYGNSWTELNFKNGLNLIEASNGSGKSTILDALCYVQNGKPYRNIKINQLINKYNEKDLLVELEFSIGNDEYKLVRGIKPNKLEIYKNNDIVDTLSSKKLNQEEIDKIFGINERLFKNVVGIGSTNNKPFLAMGAADKRALMENIFGIDILGMMSKEVKRNNTADKVSQKLSLTEYDGVNNLYEEKESQLIKLTEYNTKFDENKKSAIEKVNESIKSESTTNIADKSLLSKMESKYYEIKKIIDGCDDYQSKIIESNKTIALIESELKRVIDVICNYDNGTECPICGNLLNEGHAYKHKIVLDREHNELCEKLNNESDLLESLKEKDAELSKNKRNLDLLKMKIDSHKIKIKNSDDKIIELNEKLEQCKNLTSEFDIVPYQEKLSELTEQKDILEKRLNELNENVELNNKMIHVLGDDGLKSHFFKKLVDIMNKKINYYLGRFDMNIDITFNEFMEETILSGRYEMDYNQFSNGEKTRIDMSILLAFYEVSKVISNWSCSLLFIDEVIDGGVDSEGTEQFLSTLNNIITDTNKNIGIYIVSHKLAEVQMNWDNVIKVKKNGVFSEIEEVK